MKSANGQRLYIQEVSVRDGFQMGGLGGWPFAPGASGNVCTEDMVHMLPSMDYQTAVDLAALLSLANELPRLVEHDVPGQVMKASPSTRRYEVPTGVLIREPQARLAQGRRGAIEPACHVPEVRA